MRVAPIVEGFRCWGFLAKSGSVHPTHCPFGHSQITVTKHPRAWFRSFPVRAPQNMADGSPPPLSLTRADDAAVAQRVRDSDDPVDILNALNDIFPHTALERREQVAGSAETVNAAIAMMLGEPGHNLSDAGGASAAASIPDSDGVRERGSLQHESKSGSADRQDGKERKQRKRGALKPRKKASNVSLPPLLLHNPSPALGYFHCVSGVFYL